MMRLNKNEAIGKVHLLLSMEYISSKFAEEMIKVLNLIYVDEKTSNRDDTSTKRDWDLQ